MYMLTLQVMAIVMIGSIGSMSTYYADSRGEVFRITLATSALMAGVCLIPCAVDFIMPLMPL